MQAECGAVRRAFATAERYAAWASSPCRTFRTARGKACVWAVGGRVTYRGELLELEHGRGLAHTLRFEGFDEPATRVGSRSCRRTRWCSSKLDTTAATRRAHETTSRVGWVEALARLKSLLERVRAMPWPEGSAEADG